MDPISERRNGGFVWFVILVGKMRSVLIVDDEIGARESLKMILKSDYEVFLAKNAEEAFSQIKEHSPEVILLDIILPDLDGLEFQKE